MLIDRVYISKYILERLDSEKERIRIQYSNTENTIPFFYLDDLLPLNLASALHISFPKKEEAKVRKNLREYKYVAYKMNEYNSLLEEVLFAFQEDKVVQKIAEICQITSIFPDKSIYAGGLSLMDKGNFLNPHLDNSHDKDRNRWRILNLLYYVTPDWSLSNGGNLELWQNGLKEKQTTIVSKFNRLVVMGTHQKSWHSVSKVSTNKTRCCISNYYFSEEPLVCSDRFHITTFRGRPSEKIKDFILQIDNKIRTSLRKVFKKGIRENPHQYKS